LNQSATHFDQSYNNKKYNNDKIINMYSHVWPSLVFVLNKHLTLKAKDLTVKVRASKFVLEDISRPRTKDNNTGNNLVHLLLEPWLLQSQKQL